MKCPQKRTWAQCARITSCFGVMRFVSSILVRQHHGKNVLLHRNAPGAAHAARSNSLPQGLSAKYLSTRLHARRMPTDCPPGTPRPPPPLQATLQRAKRARATRQPALAIAAPPPAAPRARPQQPCQDVRQAHRLPCRLRARQQTSLRLARSESSATASLCRSARCAARTTRALSTPPPRCEQRQPRPRRRRRTSPTPTAVGARCESRSATHFPRAAAILPPT